MKKFSFSNFASIAMIKSNLKRFLPLMILGIIYYFLGYVLPDLLTDGVSMTSNIANTMVGVRVYAMSIPVMVSLGLFNYLHKKNAVIFHHSIPVTRTQMFGSVVITGLILINVPNILLAGYASLYCGVADAMRVLAYGFIATFFVFAICLFAAIISGTTVMHFVTSCWLNLLPQSIFVICILYAQGLLKGFASDEMLSYLAPMSPITNTFAIGSSTTLIYLLVSLAIIIVSAFMYKGMRLERSENAITFSSLKMVLNILIGVYVMFAIGILFLAETSSISTFIITSVIGAIIGVYIGYMIVNKTLRIFNKQTLKMAILLVSVAVLFCVSFIFDFYKFENKVPNINQVKSVEIDLGFDYGSYGRKYAFSEDLKEFDDRDIISNVIKIHKKMIESDNSSWQNAQNEASQGEYPYEGSITLTYKLKNGDEYSRKYFMDDSVADELKYIYESEAYKKHFSFENLKSKPSDVNIYKGDASSMDFATSDRSEINSLLEAMEKDFQSRTYEQYANNSVEYEINLHFENYSMSISVGESDKNTLEFIENYGK